ncbi:MAG: TolC family protein [Deltaproteobacteria bacterium]|nr:TolC family protein [Deltaproteobacteria bacterium]
MARSSSIFMRMTVVVAALLAPRLARGDEGGPASRGGGHDDACAVISRANVVACASGSPAIRAGREAVSAAEGRRTAAQPWFPSNPTLSLSAAQRSGGTPRTEAFNFTAALGQEIDVSGQRASRRRAADADLAARSLEVTAVSRRVAADAYAAYYEAIAAREALAVARRLEAVAEKVARVTRARADAGVGSAVDADVTDATALRQTRARMDAERDERVALATLATVLGRDPVRAAPEVSGDLAPLPGSDALAASAAPLRAPRERPEVRALDADERAFVARAEAYRRARVPTLTLQIFAQNDGFDERVLGGGLVLPLPLPQPVGRTYVGEAAEASAFASQAAARAELLARAFTRELAVALATYESARAQVALYTRERVARTEKTLGDMAAEIEAGRLAVRDAVVAQRELVEILRSELEARHALAHASIELALAAGAPLEVSR